MEKHKACIYCKHLLEKHHASLHMKQCYLNPNNLELIAAYLIQGITNPKILTRAAFYKWAKEHNILTSITITVRLGFKTWEDSLYQLLIYSYLYDYVDFEIADIIFSKINETLGMDEKTYRHYNQISVEKEHVIKGITTEDLHFNRFLMLMCVISRSLRDMEQPEGATDENKELVDIHGSCTFLEIFCPEVFTDMNIQKFSKDAENFMLN